MAHFNPRTPHGVRPSMTAPPTGATHFNPRTPHGVRLLFHCFGPDRVRFQSTHPTRGATRNRYIRIIRLQISIHAPHTGCDAFKDRRLSAITAFQSTHPTRGATIMAMFSGNHQNNFNPRTPHGVRLGYHKPLRVCFCISIHAPHTGVRLPNSSKILIHSHFNPRTPHGVRLHATSSISFRYISIHAPHTGCDDVNGRFSQLFTFQSTHPTRGATFIKQQAS